MITKKNTCEVAVRFNEENHILSDFDFAKMKLSHHKLSKTKSQYIVLKTFLNFCQTCPGGYINALF